MTTNMILLILTLFSVKHFICDFVLQSHRMVIEKGTYGKSGGLIHSGIHGAGTLLIVVWLVNWQWALVIALTDSLIHYHIDWIKSNASARYSVTDAKFWNWLGLDQLLHSLTYIGFIYWMVNYGF